MRSLSSLMGPSSSHGAFTPLHLDNLWGSQDGLGLRGSQPASVRELAPCLLSCLRAWLGEPVQVPHAVPYRLMLEQQEESPGGRPVVGKRGHRARYVKSTSQATWGVGVTGPNRKCSTDWPLLGRKYGSMSLFLGKIRASFMITKTCWCQVLILKGHQKTVGQ